MSRNYLEFEVKKERWNSYLLSDGVTLNLKVVLTNVTLEGKDQLGNPQFGFQMNNVIGMRLPPEWTQLPKEDDIPIKKVTDDWNEYTTNNGYLLKFKPVISQIGRTGTNDPMGNPIYLIQTQPLIKVSKI
jgi:hypothetical protein